MNLCVCQHRKSRTERSGNRGRTAEVEREHAEDEGRQPEEHGARGHSGYLWLAAEALYDVEPVSLYNSVCVGSFRVDDVSDDEQHARRTMAVSGIPTPRIASISSESRSSLSVRCTGMTWRDEASLSRCAIENNDAGTAYETPIMNFVATQKPTVSLLSTSRSRGHSQISHQTGMWTAEVSAQTIEFTPHTMLARHNHNARHKAGRYCLRISVLCTAKGNSTSPAAMKASAGIVGDGCAIPHCGV